MRRLSHYLFIFALVTVTLLALIQVVALASKFPASRGKPEGTRDTTGGCASSPSTGNCDHHDPANPIEGCTNPTTLQGGSANITYNGNIIGLLEARYSSACRSIWTRVTNMDGDGINIYVGITRQTDGAVDNTYAGPLANNYRFYSNMLFSSNATGRAFTVYGTVGPSQLFSLFIIAP